jgi:MFS family permease
MAFPWVAKIFLAIFSDNVTCCGSRRKSYLIINASVNILSLVLLMLFGIMYGKIFIMFCIVLSQICMTWSDAISDALIAQASRVDLKNGATNLNGLTNISYALGGAIACAIAGTIELSDGKDCDPNWYFGVYAFLIFILLLASIFLNRDLEPEIILRQR